jgi:hypothetical protein
MKTAISFCSVHKFKDSDRKMGREKTEILCHTKSKGVCACTQGNLYVKNLCIKELKGSNKLCKWIAHTSKTKLPKEKWRWRESGRPP